MAGKRVTRALASRGASPEEAAAVLRVLGLADASGPAAQLAAVGKLPAREEKVMSDDRVLDSAESGIAGRTSTTCKPRASRAAFACCWFRPLWARPLAARRRAMASPPLKRVWRHLCDGASVLCGGCASSAAARAASSS